MTATLTRAEDEAALVVIVCAGGFAREVLGIFYDLGQSERVLGFVDDDPKLAGVHLDDRPVLGDVNSLGHIATAGVQYVIGTGHTPTRLAIARKCEAAGLSPANVVSPHAVVSRFAHIQPGAIVCAGSIINTNVTIGRHCIVNLACTIGHDANLGPYSNLAPGVHVSGYARIGEGTDVGTGTTVNQAVAIGAWSIIGAGSVVVREVPANVTAVGAPARPIKERVAGWHIQA